MPLPRIRSIILVTVLSCIFVFNIFFTTIYYYDQNSFLNVIEDFITDMLHKNKPEDNDTGDNDAYVVIDINKKISSLLYKELLYYLIDSSCDSIIQEVNFNQISDSNDMETITNFIKERENIFGSIAIDNLKGLNLLETKYPDALLKNLSYSSFKYPFIFSRYLNKIEINNRFMIPPERIGFITRGNSVFNYGNLDLFFLFNKKFLYSIPFLVYINELGWDSDKISYNYTHLQYEDQKIYYDQKAKITMWCKKGDIKKSYLFSFEEWMKSIESRMKTIDYLKTIQILEPGMDDFQGYLKEQEAINSVYDIADFDNDDDNVTLSFAKTEAALWKGYKTSNEEIIKNKTVFITYDSNTKWVNDFIRQKQILDNGKNYRRIPILGIFFIACCLFYGVFFFVVLMKNTVMYPIITVIPVLLSFILYFVFRVFLHVDFPFLVFSVVIIFGFLLGLLIKVGIFKIWLLEVDSIFKDRISDKYSREIAAFWQQKKWNLDSISKNCTFLHIDTSAFLQKEIDEIELEQIGADEFQIENIIKDNQGVIYNQNSSQILSYFGNPDVYTDHGDKAVESVLLIDQMLKSRNIVYNIKFALHTKKEWFKYFTRQKHKYYYYFGNSTNTLTAINLYAKKFSIAVIMTDSVYRSISKNKHVRMLDRVRIKACGEVIRLFELLSEEQYGNNQELFDYFHAGLKLFEKKKWKEAGAYFRQCLKINPSDVPSKVYMERCKEFLYVPPDSEWDGIYEIE